MAGGDPAELRALLAKSVVSPYVQAEKRLLALEEQIKESTAVIRAHCGKGVCAKIGWDPETGPAIHYCPRGLCQTCDYRDALDVAGWAEKFICWVRAGKVEGGSAAVLLEADKESHALGRAVEWMTKWGTEV